MKCNKKRSILSLFKVYTCDGCNYKAYDETIYLGRSVIMIYHLIDECLNLEIDKDLFIDESSKLKLLLRDAVINHEDIFFCIIDDFNLNKYYDAFDKIIDDGLSVQVIAV